MVPYLEYFYFFYSSFIILDQQGDQTGHLLECRDRNGICIMMVSKKIYIDYHLSRANSTSQPVASEALRFAGSGHSSNYITHREVRLEITIR